MVLIDTILSIHLMLFACCYHLPMDFFVLLFQYSDKCKTESTQLGPTGDDLFCLHLPDTNLRECNILSPRVEHLGQKYFSEFI